MIESVHGAGMFSNQKNRCKSAAQNLVQNLIICKHPKICFNAKGMTMNEIKTNRDKVLKHPTFQTALDNFRKGCISIGKTRKNYLDACFDIQENISSELKIPLYEIGCLVRSQA